MVISKLYAKNKSPSAKYFADRLIQYLLLFTNLASETPFYSIGLPVMGVFIEIGSSPTRFLKYFLNSKFFIAIKFNWFHIYKDIQKFEGFQA